MAEEIVKAYDEALKVLLKIQADFEDALREAKDTLMIARREALKRLREGEPGEI